MIDIQIIIIKKCNSGVLRVEGGGGGFPPLIKDAINPRLVFETELELERARESQLSYSDAHCL